MNTEWKPIPASLYDLIFTGDLEALLWQLKGVREAEEVRMALYNARKAILDTEEYSDCTPAPTSHPIPTGATGEDERKAFEAFQRKTGLDELYLERHATSGLYAWTATKEAWETWQAARASVAAPAAGDALDAARYRAWRDQMIGNNQPFRQAIAAALPKEVGDTRHPTAAEWDAAIDAAIAQQSQRKEA